MRFKNATEAFEYFYDYILKNGIDFDNTKAIFNTGFSILNPLDNIITTPWRKWNEEYAKMEWLWYLSGNRDATEISKKAKIWLNMMDEDSLVWSNYGYWWKRNYQLSNVINMLKGKPETRKAIICHYNPDEIQHYQKDTPCNLILNFYIVDNKLCLTVFARSIDLVYGYCNDQYMFSNLMRIVSNELKLEVGSMFYSITNLHIYPRHYNLKEKNS